MTQFLHYRVHQLRKKVDQGRGSGSRPLVRVDQIRKSPLWTRRCSLNVKDKLTNSPNKQQLARRGRWCPFARQISSCIDIDDTNPKCSCGQHIGDAIHFLLECQLYNNQRISLFNNLIIMNIEINIETPLFANDTYTDHTNSINFEKVRFFIKQTKRCCTPSQQLQSFVIVCFFLIFLIPPFVLIHDSFVYHLFLILCCISL